jgi:hypothetical protein
VTTPIAGGKRRIDRVLAEDFMVGLDGLSLEELRARRDDADQEETDLSYLRRMLQGRLDIIRAEVVRRSDSEGGDGAALVASLPRIFAEETRSGPAGLGRHRSTEPSRAGETRRQEEALVADLELSDPAALGDEELRHAAEALLAEERDVSSLRKRVQAVLDHIGGEIARRYRDGVADIGALLQP